MSTNHDENLMDGSIFDLFAQTQETLDDAKRKTASESSTRIDYFSMSKDGTYPVRIMPLAPVILPDNTIDTKARKGYEYPLKDLGLKITGLDKNQKEVQRTVFVCHTKLVFPDLENDLIDLYVRIACDQNSGDKTLCEKLTSNSFSGGLKYNAKRCMYVLDTKERAKGLQILQLSYKQYRDLEDAKLRLWGKLAQKGKQVTCPISSPLGAYPVEITRKTENRKVSYTLDIDTINGVDELSQEDLQTLLDAPRLPEVLYVYRRRHLEATIAFLQQQDKKYNINVMASEEIKDCIDQIKMRLPADDQSHFTFDATETGNDTASKMTLDELWRIYDELEKEGLTDRSEEGQNLRTQIREFIEDNNLDIRVDRKKSNLVVLEEIGELMDGQDNDGYDDDDAESDGNNADLEDSDEGYDDADEADDEPASPRDTRNDDTNEPAARPSASRRVNRAPRRR